MKITQEQLKEALDYDQETGVFRWKNAMRNGSIKQFAIAGSLDKEGYMRICIQGSFYNSHRLAWLYCNGELPPDEVDHINGMRSDNRISNLRLADRFMNTQNISLRKDSVSGYLGVSFYPPTKKWKAQIRHNKKTSFLGYFDDPAVAHDAYICAKKELHPGFSYSIERAVRGVK